VGAGPGDPELLTLKAVRALQSADVILYDDLVSTEILDLARREAKRMLVGKRGGKVSCRQEDINDLMVKLAKQGRHVVRLKAGDPATFGRAGEEIERLAREGLAVTVVPGITTASAMAAELGLSLTHRDCAQSVRFVTGHARSGELPDDFDWRGLADPRTTLVVYMGGRTARQLAARLVEAGLDRAVPVVAMSTPAWRRFMAVVCRRVWTVMCFPAMLGQDVVAVRTWAASLGDLLDQGLPDDLRSPVLLGIGAAFHPLRSRANLISADERERTFGRIDRAG
jgi:uroporphyrin-III C-methyltransferase/precorrin-2 dehydrogenase/sirohydrochlorin ferrochelatase